MRALTTVLLKHDFGLDWDMPITNLCPPVPMVALVSRVELTVRPCSLFVLCVVQRLNYIHWVADLIGKTKRDPSVKGLDM